MQSKGATIEAGPMPSGSAVPAQDEWGFWDEFLDYDWRGLVHKPWFRMTLLCLASLAILFFPLLQVVGVEWFGKDTYYAHGSIIPFCAIYVLYEWWPDLHRLRVKGSLFALIPLLGGLYLNFVAIITNQVPLMSSVALMIVIASIIWLLAGFRWVIATSPIMALLTFSLPVWRVYIDAYTIPLVNISTEISYFLLRLTGQDPYRASESVVMLNNFVLNVAEPCSGLKLILAVFSLAAFFMLVARLSFWGNLVLFLSALPLCLALNGLRIAMIGVVGNAFGSAAGSAFHDYSGYITLALCFYILMKLTRWLGWK